MNSPISAQKYGLNYEHYPKLLPSASSPKCKVTSVARAPFIPAWFPDIPSSFSPLSHERVDPFKCSASVPNTFGAHESQEFGYIHIDQLVISFAYHGMTGNARIIISCFVLHGVCTAQDTKCFNVCRPIIIGAHMRQLMEVRLCTLEACKEKKLLCSVNLYYRT